MDVSVDATGYDQQAAGVELVVTRYDAADLGYPAVPDPDIGDLPVPGRDDGAATNDKLKMLVSHADIVPSRFCMHCYGRVSIPWGSHEI
jgi:hypothetical protein